MIFTAPLTTSDHTGANSIVIPDSIRQHVGLDPKSRIIVTEYNRFLWVGPDIEPLHDGRIHLGVLPAKLVRQALELLLENRSAKMVKRTD